MFRWHSLSTLLLFPYLLSISSGDTSYSDILLGAGTGKYAYRDCSGLHERHYVDAGVTLSAKTRGPFRIGGTLGGAAAYGEDRGAVALVYPELALDFKSFAVGTTGLRIGEFDETYLHLGIFNCSPPVSGKGILNLGLGWKTDAPFSRLWIGANTIPYGNLGLAVQPEFPLSDNRFLFVTGRYGVYENISEWGVYVGVRIRSR